MQIAHVATITSKPEQLSAFLLKAETELLPLYRDLPGFVAYTVAKTGEAAAVCFGIWQTREQAEQAIKTSEKWIKGEIGQLVDGSRNRVGDLPFLAVTRELGAYASIVAPVGGARA